LQGEAVIRFPRVVLIVCAGALSACAHAPPDQSQAIARALVGQWEHQTGDAECPGTSSEAYRANGTYTATSTSCDLTSDGFGIFRYGWYVARQHVCYVGVEEQYKDEVKRPKLYREMYLAAVKEGFVEDRCVLRVLRVTTNAIEMVATGADSKPFTMRRKRWL
jgi:hypothetical protein